MLPAFADLYGVDFDTITDEQAMALNARIVEKYRTDKWLHEVVVEKANIELMLLDKYWNRLNFDREYRFTAPVLNVTELMRGSHPDQFTSDNDSPYIFARQRNLSTATLDDYLAVIDVIFTTAVAADAVCLKSTQAYQRSLTYEPVTPARAKAIYGKAPDAITAAEQRDENRAPRTARAAVRRGARCRVRVRVRHRPRAAGAHPALRA